jgi:alpha-L-fucosidase 2
MLMFLTHVNKKQLLLFTLVLSCRLAGAQIQKQNLALWYRQPASTWNEALPVGNGRLGAMIFGGIDSEHLQLNEQTVWSGGNEDFVNPAAKESLAQIRRLLFSGKYKEAEVLAQETMMGNKKSRSSYQTLGDLYIDFEHGEGTVKDYQRELDLEKAVATVRYQVDSTRYLRRIFSSAPDQAIAIRIEGDKKGAVTCLLRLTRPGNKASVDITGHDIIWSEHVGNGNGVRLVGRLKAMVQGGRVRIDKGHIRVEKADALTLLVTAATDYWGGDPLSLATAALRKAAKKTWAALNRDHLADYQQYFKRVDLKLGHSDVVDEPTDARIAALKAGRNDLPLLELYYQFGRYLLISSSRPGGLPANLQGIWADGLNPPWEADYHININIQMNYWPAEVTQLSELHAPFLAFINKLRVDGRKTARDMYGLEGTVAHFTTDAWGFTETYGQTQWAMWPMGLAWCSRHFWEHWLFTGDKKFLEREAYPVMKEAAEFCLNWLTPHPESRELVSGPSISPENKFRTKEGEEATIVMGPTMDHMIIRDLFRNTVEAAVLLNRDLSFRNKLRDALQKLAPTKIGQDGRILEWTESFEEPEPGHRHISHLFGLHPGHEITSKTPELLAAAKKTIEYRLAHGGGHTGWSRAWIINFFARLQDGEAAYQNLIALLQKSTLPNLFDNHPPFQIDGNFGAVAGMSEMLLQSHAGEIELLPALPAAWPEGSVRGLMARGGFEISMSWSHGKLKEAVIRSRLGHPCRLRYGSKTMELKTKKGRAYAFTADLEKKTGFLMNNKSTSSKMDAQITAPHSGSL